MYQLIATEISCEGKTMEMMDLFGPDPGMADFMELRF